MPSPHFCGFSHIRPHFCGFSHIKLIRNGATTKRLVWDRTPTKLYAAVTGNNNLYRLKTAMVGCWPKG